MTAALRSAPLGLFGLALALGIGIGMTGCQRGDRDEFTDRELERLNHLSVLDPDAPPLLLGLHPPPSDPSNRWALQPGTYPGCDITQDDCDISDAARLGRMLYFDPRFSGNATLVDVLGRATPYARAAKGAPASVACADCHDLSLAGTDPRGSPVSIGAGWYDVNSQQTVNAAYYPLLYWNGRSDSLWQQITQVNESAVSMNSTRMRTAWGVADNYPGYTDLFGTDLATMAGAPARFAPGGVKDGKPGATAGCQAGDASEPFGDAFDCLTADDQAVVNRVYVNFAKAIAAYEYALVRGNSAFDRFMHPGAQGAGELSPSAKRGARLFVGKAGCYDCHNTELLSDGNFHDIGVPQVGEFVPTTALCASTGRCDCTEGASTALATQTCPPWGAWDGLGKLRRSALKRDSRASDDIYCASSRKGFVERVVSGCDGAPEAEAVCPSNRDDVPTPKPALIDYGIPDVLPAALIGAWRTPSLRDVALTAPYMHTGVYRTLEEVVAHYNRGGSADDAQVSAGAAVDAGSAGDAGCRAGLRGRAVPIKPLGLDDDEQRDLVEFLNSLTGEQLPRKIACKPKLPPDPPSADCP